MTGVDLSARQVALARHNVPTATFLHADITQLDFAPTSFDAVAAFYSLMHVPCHEHLGLLRKTTVWLRAGGVLVATLWPHATEATFADDGLGAPMYWSGFDSATTMQLVEAAGLHLLRAEEETVEEFGVPITFLWVIAEKSAQRHAAGMSFTGAARQYASNSGHWQNSVCSAYTLSL